MRWHVALHPFDAMTKHNVAEANKTIYTLLLPYIGAETEIEKNADNTAAHLISPSTDNIGKNIVNHIFIDENYDSMDEIYLIWFYYQPP